MKAKQIGVICKPGNIDLFKRLKELALQTGTFADIEFVKIEYERDLHGRTLTGLIEMPDAKSNPHYKELLNISVYHVREKNHENQK